MEVEQNKVVSFHYTLRLESGKIFDTTRTHKPLQIIVGYHHVIPGLEAAIMGLKIGDEQMGKIKPKDAYGSVNKKLIKVYPRHIIPKSIQLKKGCHLKRKKKDGQQVKAVVRDYNETRVVLDSNHPLAGKNLNYTTKIVNIREATRGELQAGVVNNF